MCAADRTARIMGDEGVSGSGHLAGGALDTGYRAHHLS